MNVCSRLVQYKQPTTPKVILQRIKVQNKVLTISKIIVYFSHTSERKTASCNIHISTHKSVIYKTSMYAGEIFLISLFV